MTPERRREIEAWLLKDDDDFDTSYGGCEHDHEGAQTIIRELLTALDCLQAELHSGHVLVPFDERYHQSLRRESSRASSDRLGWLICTRDGCGYEVPSHGWCPEHMTLDACWAYEAYTTNESEETIDGSLREG